MSDTPLQKLNKLCVTVAYATREWDQYNDHVVHSANVIPMAIEIESLHEQLAACEKDAERYQLLRRGQHWSVINGIGDELRAGYLDAAIDAAIAKVGATA